MICKECAERADHHYDVNDRHPQCTSPVDCPCRHRTDLQWDDMYSVEEPDGADLPS